MSKQSDSVLSFAILGLLYQAPHSGYDIRKLFADSPLKLFSSSPGSIYPALHRLRSQGLIEVKGEVPTTGRRKETFELTDTGLSELKEWLQRPITQDDVIWSLEELQLRFAFIGEVLGLENAISFLSSFERELSAYLSYLETYALNLAGTQSICGRLAFECGIDGYRMQALWARRALDELIVVANQL